MEKIKQYRYFVLVIIVLLGFSFYWFQIRPAQIIKNCLKNNPQAFDNSWDTSGQAFRLENLIKNNEIDLDKAGYQKCLRENGLKI